MKLPTLGTRKASALTLAFICLTPQSTLELNYLSIFSGQHPDQRVIPFDEVMEQRCENVQPDQPIACHTQPFMNAFEEFRSEEHTSELQSLMRISYAVFCLK